MYALRSATHVHAHYLTNHWKLNKKGFRVSLFRFRSRYFPPHFQEKRKQNVVGILCFGHLPEWFICRREQQMGRLFIPAVPADTLTSWPQDLPQVEVYRQCLAYTSPEELLGLAEAALQEFICICSLDHVSHLNINGILDGKKCARALSSKPSSLKAELTRTSGQIIAAATEIVENVVQMNKWVELYPSIISRAVSLEVLESGVPGNRDGALHLMYAELQALSPLVPTRKFYFLRYCKHQEDDTWAVVDVGLDDFCGKQLHPVRCRRQPSGHLIKGLVDGCSMVTVLEHMESNNNAVKDPYDAIVNTGMAFGAQRWFGTLEHHFQRLSNSSGLIQSSAGISRNGRRSILKLSQRMIKKFCSSFNASNESQEWKILSRDGEDDVLVMMRENADKPGDPKGVILSAAMSVWIPATPQEVFDFLCDEQYRHTWDLFALESTVEEVARIRIGQNVENRVSLLRFANNTYMLQESSLDSSGYMLVYAPASASVIGVILNGSSSAALPILPSGFAILPDGPQNRPPRCYARHGHRRGALLTIAYQVAFSSLPAPPDVPEDAVASLKNLIHCTEHQITKALQTVT